MINNLVRNPRTPVGIALNLVSRLGPLGIKDIAVDRSMPEALRRQAHEASEKAWREHEAKARAEGVAVQRQLAGLVANTMRSVQALEAKHTPGTAAHLRRDRGSQAVAGSAGRRPQGAQEGARGGGKGGRNHRPGHAAAVTAPRRW
jgi:post-segregation antitoxin (ccd killing protein)